jgi:FdhD protein
MRSTPSDPGPGGAQRDLADGRADWLVREEPLWIEVHNHRLLTMRTPGRDEDLAVGFLLGEGVLSSADQIAAVTTAPGDLETMVPDRVSVTLGDVRSARIEGRLARTHEIRPSCGVCGLVDADALLDELPPLLPGRPRLHRADIERWRADFVGRGTLFAATGGCHAASLVLADGRTIGHAEDVGRHNALDKAIGQAARAGEDLTTAIALLSGRAGFDLVLKLLRVRVGVILSVSAPSALAFDLCQSAGATLLGFVREGRAQLYCDGGRRLDE